MIRIFRQLRAQFIKNSKINKYLFYAIGEILLVVIGILIALQVNNWNEERRSRKIEVKLLTELREDLIATREDLLTDLEKTNSIMELTDSVYVKIIGGRANNTYTQVRITKSYLTDTPMLFPKLSAYKSIQAFGVNIISNDSLRKLMTDLFELRMERVTLTESYLYELDNSAFKPYFRNFSKPDNDCQNCLTLEDQFGSFERMRQNMFVLENPQDDFLHMLKDKYNILRALEARYDTLNQQIEAMINTINSEIKNGQ